MSVEILCATYEGAAYLADLLDSIEAQTYEDWRLWIRDDGSADDTVAIARERSARDPRIQLLGTEGSRLGAAGSFAWLLEHTAGDAPYVMFADQDDVWLPQKIERTLAAMRAAESAVGSNVPLLVHTDMIVASANLATLHASFWEYAGFQPEPATLRRIVVRNVALGATTMINRALRELASPVPGEAFYHDWWCACVAAAFGRIEAVHEPTMLYRQHGANVVGARDGRVTLRTLPGAIVYSLRGTNLFRRNLVRTAAQSRALLERYGNRMPARDRAFLEAYSRIPEMRFASRKLALLKLRTLPEYGMLQTIGVVLRG